MSINSQTLDKDEEQSVTPDASDEDMVEMPVVCELQVVPGCTVQGISWETSEWITLIALIMILCPYNPKKNPAENRKRFHKMRNTVNNYIRRHSKEMTTKRLDKYTDAEVIQFLKNAKLFSPHHTTLCARLIRLQDARLVYRQLAKEHAKANQEHCIADQWRKTKTKDEWIDLLGKDWILFLADTVATSTDS
jgi:hypothetical protein